METIQMNLPSIDGDQVYRVRTNRREFFVIGNRRRDSVACATMQLQPGEMIYNIVAYLDVIDSRRRTDEMSELIRRFEALNQQ